MTDISPQMESFGISADSVRARVVELQAERDERCWELGRKAAYTSIMLSSLRALGFDSATEAELARVDWIEERQAAVNALRDLCETFGDNDWPDELHLGDVIEKHLARPLHKKNIK